MRVPVNWEISLQQGDQVTKARALEFSEFGLLVGPPDIVRVGQRYDVSLPLPGQRAPIRVSGYVVYSTARGVGIRFERVSPELTAVFRDYMKRHMPAPPAEP